LLLEFEGATNHDLDLDIIDLMLWRDQMLDAYALWVTSAQRPSTATATAAGTGPTTRSAGAPSSETPTPPTNTELTVNEQLKAPLLFERRVFIDQLMHMKSHEYTQKARFSSFDPKEAIKLLALICAHVEWTREDCQQTFDDAFGGENAPPAIVTNRSPPGVRQRRHCREKRPER